MITGNWGSDLALLIKAANDADLNNVNFYTYYGSVTGSPTAMGLLLQAACVHGGLCPHEPAWPLNQIVVDYKKKFNDDMYTGSIYHAFTMLSEAFCQDQVHRPGEGGGTD